MHRANQDVAGLKMIGQTTAFDQVHSEAGKEVLTEV